MRGSSILYSRSRPSGLGDRAANGDLPGSSRFQVFSLDLEWRVMQCPWFRMMKEVESFFRYGETRCFEWAGQSKWIGSFFELAVEV